MRRLFTFSIWAAGLGLLSSCDDKTSDSTLLNTHWKLVQVEDFPIVASSYSETHRSYIEFTSGTNRTTGLGPCNGFSGSFSLGKEPGILTISPQAATKIFCAGVGIETQYLEALSRTVRYEIVGHQLSLYDATNSLKPLLIFEDRSSEE